MDVQTDRQTDGIAVASTAFAMRRAVKTKQYLLRKTTRSPASADGTARRQGQVVEVNVA